MRRQEDYLRDFAVFVTEKGVVSVSDPQQIAVYDYLGKGRRRPIDIAEALGLPSSSLHFVLDKMVDSGIIVRLKPDPARKEVYYSNLALRIAGSHAPSREDAEAMDRAFAERAGPDGGTRAVADMMEAYLDGIGFEHRELRVRYARELADSISGDVGKGPLESAMPGIRDRFRRLTGFRLSVFGLTPLTVVLEGGPSMAPKVDMLSELVARMAGNATGKPYAVRSVEDFSNDESSRFKVVFERAEPEQARYLNCSLPQIGEPERFTIVEIDGRAALVASEIQARLVDAMYERPLCVTDIVNEVGMPRSTVTTNLLRMVEEGVATVFYAESGAIYYGLSCSVLMKRCRRSSRDASAVRSALAAASGDGMFAEGYMLYTLAYLGGLGFDTDYLMIVLGARYMRTAAGGPRSFDNYYGEMSAMAGAMGVPMSLVSVYPLTIGIEKSQDPCMGPATLFAKGMAHQGLEMASSGIFVRVTEETQGEVRISFKEIFPSLSMSQEAAAEAEAVAEASPSAKKRTSSVRDALRNRSASTEGKPKRTVRYITGVAAALVAVILVLCAGGAGVDVSAETYELEFPDEFTVLDEDGCEIASPYTVNGGETLALAISAEGGGCVGAVSDGVAYLLSDMCQECDGYYLITFEGDIALAPVFELDGEFPGLSVLIYSFLSEVADSYAYSFDGYYALEEYAAASGGLWVTEDAVIVLEAADGCYVSVDGLEGVYPDLLLLDAILSAGACSAELPEEYAVVDLGNGEFEVGGYFFAGLLRVALYQTLTLELVSTDGPVSVTMDQPGQTAVAFLDSLRTFSFYVNGDTTLEYAHVGVA